MFEAAATVLQINAAGGEIISEEVTDGWQQGL
jgi:hypothetical protein